MFVMFFLVMFLSLPNFADERSKDFQDLGLRSENLPEKCLSNLEFLIKMKTLSNSIEGKFYLDENCDIKYIINDNQAVSKATSSDTVAKTAIKEIGKIGIISKNKTEAISEIVEIYYNGK